MNTGQRDNVTCMREGDERMKKVNEGMGREEERAPFEREGWMRDWMLA